jgi:uroporphyrinogen decarboxylase
MLQVFDSWASELSPHDFADFSFPTLKYISTNVRSKLTADNNPVPPMTLFAKGANHALAFLAENAGYDVLGLDWCIEPAEARKLVGNKVALQGNLDPNVLYGGKEAIEREVKRMCEGFKGGGKELKGWIANLGHGITPGVDPEDLRWFFECIHKYSALS